MAKLADADVGGFIARLFPGASEAALEAITKFHLWGFAFDDEIERMAVDRLTDAVDAHGDLMRVLDAPRSTVQVASPYGKAFRDISDAFRDLATPAVWRRWIDSSRAFALGVVWDAHTTTTGPFPAPTT
ncbi:terpene synthase family protein [Streptomyces sp. NPDC059003]|uniref:terpene synthase family protein n=1 Tax=Streptomyces sp. NPDC059003 TaxID=3346691 RepID=UPI0036AEBD50